MLTQAEQMQQELPPTGNSSYLLILESCRDAMHCVSTVQYYYSTTFFIAVMAARSSAPQISIE